MTLNFNNDVITINGDGTEIKTLTFFKKGHFEINMKTEPTYRDITVSGINSVMLSDAKENGLNYIKLFGKCQQNESPYYNAPSNIICNNGVLKQKWEGGNFTPQNSEIYRAYFRQESASTNPSTWQYFAGDGSTSFRIAIQPNIKYRLYWNTANYTSLFRVAFVKNNEYPISGSYIPLYKADGSRGISLISTARDNPTFTFVATDDSITHVAVQIAGDQGWDVGDLTVLWERISNLYLQTEKIYADGTTESLQITGENLSNTATAEMLLSSGSYKDTQSVLNGNISRNTGVLVLDGSETWEYSANYSDTSANACFYYSTIPAVTPILPQTADNINCLCTHFNWTSTNNFSSNTTSIAGAIIGQSGTSIALRVPLSIANTSPNDFKQWLSNQYSQGAPIILVYPLATAKSEDVTAQPMTLGEGTNIATVTGSINNLELEVNYKAGVLATVTEIQNEQLDDNVEVIINE